MADAPVAFQARALLLGTRLDLRSWPEAEVLARVPLAVRVAGGGVAVLFRHGAAVLFDVSTAAERTLRERLAPLVENAYSQAEEETLAIRIDATCAEGLTGDALVLQAAGLARLQLVAEVLARSALLAHYETRLGAELDRIAPFALHLEREGRTRGSTSEQLRRIGGLLRMEHRMVALAEVGEKPELLWERPELERLFALLESEFEVRERMAILERKLALGGRTARTMADLINARHALRVEWYIVGLIVFEILLTLYGMWRAP